MATIIGTIRRDTLRGVVDNQSADTNSPGNPVIAAFGDALVIEGTGRGGHDRLIGSGARDGLNGDATLMRGNAIAGDFVF
jgi:hypothetical protein